METNRENLKALLEQFCDSETAEYMQQDIQKGDQLLAGYDAPKPSQMALDQIKAQLGDRLKARSRHKLLRRTTAAVAAIAAILIIGIFAAYDPTQPQLKPDAETPTGWAFAGESESEMQLYTELADIEDSLVQLRTGDGNTFDEQSVDDLENEFNEIAGDFWKG